MPKGNGNFKITRNGIKNDEWELVRVDTSDDFAQFNNFCCGDDDLNDFIKNDALAHKTELIVETYVLKEATSQFPVAFISFCNDSIPLSNLRRQSKKMLPKSKRYPNMPAVKIARLGVISDYQRNHIGTNIINMTKEFFTTDNRTGCRFLTVDAYTKEDVIRFYERNDFQCLKTIQTVGNQTQIMYLDLKRFKD